MESEQLFFDFSISKLINGRDPLGKLRIGLSPLTSHIRQHDRESKTIRNPLSGIPQKAGDSAKGRIPFLPLQRQANFTGAVTKNPPGIFESEDIGRNSVPVVHAVPDRSIRKAQSFISLELFRSIKLQTGPN